MTDKKQTAFRISEGLKKRLIAEAKKYKTAEEFIVSSVVDNQYGLTQLNHEASSYTISWKESIVDDPDPQQGIPGYPEISILIGLTASILFFLKKQRY